MLDYVPELTGASHRGRHSLNFQRSSTIANLAGLFRPFLWTMWRWEHFRDWKMTLSVLLLIRSNKSQLDDHNTHDPSYSSASFTERPNTSSRAEDLPFLYSESLSTLTRMLARLEVAIWLLSPNHAPQGVRRSDSLNLSCSLMSHPQHHKIAPTSNRYVTCDSPLLSLYSHPLGEQTQKAVFQHSQPLFIQTVFG